MNTELSEGYVQRFAGLGRLYGQDSLLRLARGHVAVIGIGGVGSWVAEALARSGIGELTLVDLDDICISNSNRQVHTTVGTIGSSKVAVMAERLSAINPEIVVHQVEEFVDPENARALLEAIACDLLVDACDSANAKSSLIAVAKRAKMPVVTVGSAGGKADPSQISCVDLTKTTQDPLLAKVRNQLRRLHGFSRNPKRRFGVDAVYSLEPMRYPQADGSVCQQKTDMKSGVKLDCSGGFGAACMVTSSFGMVAAAKAVERLLALPIGGELERSVQ